MAVKTKKKTDELTCPYCEKVFPDKRGFHVHVEACKAKAEAVEEEDNDAEGREEELEEEEDTPPAKPLKKPKAPAATGEEEPDDLTAKLAATEAKVAKMREDMQAEIKKLSESVTATMQASIAAIVEKVNIVVSEKVNGVATELANAAQAELDKRTAGAGAKESGSGGGGGGSGLGGIDKYLPFIQLITGGAGNKAAAGADLMTQASQLGNALQAMLAPINAIQQAAFGNSLRLIDLAQRFGSMKPEERVAALTGLEHTAITPPPPAAAPPLAK